MSDSKKISITTQYLTVTNKPVIRNMPFLVKKFGLKSGDSLEPYLDSAEYFDLSDLIKSLFDHLQWPTNTSFLFYSNIINDINRAEKEKLDYIDMTKKECETLKSIFEASPIKISEHNSYFKFIIELFDDIIKNFDVPVEEVSETPPEITN